MTTSVEGFRALPGRGGTTWERGGKGKKRKRKGGILTRTLEMEIRMGERKQKGRKEERRTMVVVVGMEVESERQSRRLR